jgi:Uma2 family endonuclease
MSVALPETELPARISFERPMSDEALLRFCAENPLARVEREPNGDIKVMSPTGNEGVGFETDILVELANWAAQDGRGRAYNSNAGWKLRDGSMRAADAHWISWGRLNAVPKRERKGFPQVCPEFVIEVRSETDTLKTLQEKMLEWLANGAELGWLVDPQRKVVEVYRAGQEKPDFLEGVTSVYGEGPVRGFVLELGKVWG